MGLGLGKLDVALRRCLTGVVACVRYLSGIVRAAAFWGSILLPLVIVGGLLTEAATEVPHGLVSLVGLNVLCLLLSRSYRPGE